MNAKMKQRQVHLKIRGTVCSLIFYGTLCVLRSALAEVTWYGDFFTNLPANTTPSLRQYLAMQCGWNNVGSCTCPYRNDNTCYGGQQQNTSDIQAPLGSCPAGNSNCRFFFVASPGAPNGGTTPVLKTTVSYTDFTNNGRRNELALVTEQGGAKNYYTEGDDRYFTWNWYAPADLPDPPQGIANPWHSVFQFHELGLCGGCDAIMGNGLISNGKATPAYQMFLQVNEVYQYQPPHCAEILFRTPDLGSIEFTKGSWHNFVLHVYFSQSRCNNGNPCNWVAPNGGVMELWIDHAYKGSWARITDYTWPNPWACDADRIAGFPTSGPMPIYLKLGIYRNPDITYDESWFFNGVMAATTCADVWGAGLSPTCPRF